MPNDPGAHRPNCFCWKCNRNRRPDVETQYDEDLPMCFSNIRWYSRFIPRRQHSEKHQVIMTARDQGEVTANA